MLMYHNFSYFFKNQVNPKDNFPLPQVLIIADVCNNFLPAVPGDKKGGITGAIASSKKYLS